jgi:hypothetical protein
MGRAAKRGKTQLRTGTFLSMQLQLATPLSRPLGQRRGDFRRGESDGNNGGVEDVVSSGEVVRSGEGWVSCTDEGASGCTSTEGEAAGAHCHLRQRRRQCLRSILVHVDGARRRHEMINS